MGLFSNLFTPREPSEEEIAKQKMTLLMKKLRELTLRLTHKRIAMQEGENVMSLEKLQQLSDYDVSSLPENNIVTMAGIYRKFIGGGATHEEALQVVNATRVHPIQWRDTSRFQTIEEYIAERLKVELAPPSLSSSALKYYTQDFISNSIQQTNLAFHEIFGY